MRAASAMAQRLQRIRRACRHPGGKRRDLRRREIRTSGARRGRGGTVRTAPSDPVPSARLARRPRAQGGADRLRSMDSHTERPARPDRGMPERGRRTRARGTQPHRHGLGRPAAGTARAGGGARTPPCRRRRRGQAPSDCGQDRGGRARRSGDQRAGLRCVAAQRARIGRRQHAAPAEPRHHPRRRPRRLVHRPAQGRRCGPRRAGPGGGGPCPGRARRNARPSRRRRRLRPRRSRGNAGMDRAAAGRIGGRLRGGQRPLRGGQGDEECGGA